LLWYPVFRGDAEPHHGCTTAAARARVNSTLRNFSSAQLKNNSRWRTICRNVYAQKNNNTRVGGYILAMTVRKDHSPSCENELVRSNNSPRT